MADIGLKNMADSATANDAAPINPNGKFKLFRYTENVGIDICIDIFRIKVVAVIKINGINILRSFIHFSKL
jgi:hypothetical protein